MGGIREFGKYDGLGVKEFEKEIREEEIRKVQIRKEKEKEKILNPEAEVFRRSELLKKYIAKILFG